MLYRIARSDVWLGVGDGVDGPNVIRIRIRKCSRSRSRNRVDGSWTVQFMRFFPPCRVAFNLISNAYAVRLRPSDRVSEEKKSSPRPTRRERSVASSRRKLQRHSAVAAAAAAAAAVLVKKKRR